MAVITGPNHITNIYVPGTRLILTFAIGLEVGFGESDILVREDDEFTEVLITSSGNIARGESVVLEVLPLTLDQYVAMNRSIPNIISSNKDPAESGTYVCMYC